MTLDPDVVRRAAASPRWTGLVRTGLDAAAIDRWDPTLLRESRVLVPVDLQALVVDVGSSEPTVRVPLALAAPDGRPPTPATPVLEDGPPREAGVHLHWAPPDALLRGTLSESSEDGPRRLGLPPLPDRWVVLRLLVPAGDAAPSVRGWVLEADTARAVPLEAWPAGSADVEPQGRTVPTDELTGAAGGSLNWVGVYDAGVNRLGFHDPLDDLAAVAPDGLEGAQAGYLVAGWWSEAAHDPLDGAQTSDSLHARLDALGWALVDDREGGDVLDRSRAVQSALRDTIGLATAARYAGTPDEALVGAPSLAATGIDAVRDSAVVARPFRPTASAFADASRLVELAEPGWPRSVLLHGAVYGVPVSGPSAGGVPEVDNRPAATDVGVVLGEHGDDAAAAMASAGIAGPGASDDVRRPLERLLAAFTGQLLDRVGTPDGLVDVEEHEHAAGFVGRSGGAGGTDRLLAGSQEAAGGRTGRADAERVRLGATRPIRFARTRGDLTTATVEDQKQDLHDWQGPPQPAVDPVAARAREVIRPAPRLHLPVDPQVAVRGARRSLRHGGDGRFSPDGRLHCRWPSQVVRAVDQVVQGSEVLPSLGSGAVPDEVLLLAREGLLANPFLVGWLASFAATGRGLDPDATRVRLTAEAALRFGADGTYDGTTPALAPDPPGLAGSAGAVRTRLSVSLVADQLRRFSLVRGTDPDPVGVTAWSQPWVPLWLEWEAVLETADRLDGWSLGAVDDDPDPDAPTDPTPDQSVARTFRGRSPLTTGTATTLAAGVRAWLAAEDARDLTGEGEADEDTEAALARIADAVEHLDVVTASLDGLREQLLGFAYDGGLLRPLRADGTLGPPETTGRSPTYLRAGGLTLARARLVDAFGRTLELPVAAAGVSVRSSVPDRAGSLRLRPRLTVPARLLLRLVDAADGATEARVDQVDPAAMVNPVAGFLLPDHIDEALEVFDVAGRPLGQLSQDPISGGVGWEIAPGRVGPADAGPLFGLDGGARVVGRLAAGVVAADARARDGRPPRPDQESALSALLRAIDTTLWSIDAFSSFGSEHIAGLVGRPIAVVRVRLTLELVPDLGLDAATAVAALADRAVTVRLGELTRTDDGLLAYLVGDDTTRLRIVDKVVAGLALDSGPGRGQLGRYGTTPLVPEVRPIDHPYLLAEDELVIRPGQTIDLTLLMHPAGRVHLTSGLLPRKSIQLARDWVNPGLSVMAPSARVGPVLVDPAEVRLPLISSFPVDQVLTRRDTPSSWRDDPILAATQAALMPDLPAEVQEGYLRVAPDVATPATADPARTTGAP